MCPWEPPAADTPAQADDSSPVESDLGAPTPGEGLIDGFNPYEYSIVEGPDGLPTEVSPPWQSQDAAPIPLTPDTMTCLPQPKDEWTPDGLPECRYYKRQRVHNPQAPDRPQVTRFCTHESLRGINGAALTLDDSGVFDCEMRDPPHPRAKRALDRIDFLKIKLGRERLEHERQTGKVHGYRLFRTPEDVKQGRFVLDEGDVSDADVSRRIIADPLAEDLPAPAPEPTQHTDRTAPDDGGKNG